MGGEPSAYKSILDEVRIKAHVCSPEEYLDYVDTLVEAFRRHIESLGDDPVGDDLREIYRDIIRFALTCQLTADAPKDPGFLGGSVSASC